MPSDDRSVAPAIRDSLALAELAEFTDRAPHLDFGLARRRAIADALLGPTSVRPRDRATPGSSPQVPLPVRRHRR